MIVSTPPVFPFAPHGFQACTVKAIVTSVSKNKYAITHEQIVSSPSVLLLAPRHFPACMLNVEVLSHQSHKVQIILAGNANMWPSHLTNHALLD